MRIRFFKAGFGRQLSAGAIAAVCAGLAGSLAAEPLSYKAARQQLFKPDGAQVAVFQKDYLSEKDVEVLLTVGAQLRYYGAIALAPDDGVLSNSLQGNVDHHSTDAARAGALAACEEKRESETPCEVVALVSPKNWEARELQLSGTATEGVRKIYRKLKSPKAFAISPANGEWQTGTGEAAQALALENCAAVSGAEDCVVVIADP